jgi:hypothetical protein
MSDKEIKRVVIILSNPSSNDPSDTGSVTGLSPTVHPAMGRVPMTFELRGLGEATGRGAEPVAKRSAPPRCGPGAL